MKKLSLLLSCALVFGLSACDEVSKVTSPTEKAAATIAAPVFSPAGGTYTSAQSVTLTSATASTVIYYTLDGSTPTLSSQLYLQPITVAKSVTIKAMAVTTTTGSSSEVVSASFFINGSVVDTSKDTTKAPGDTTKTPTDTTKKDSTVVPPVTTDRQRITGTWIASEDGSGVQWNFSEDGSMSLFVTSQSEYGLMYIRQYADWSVRNGLIVFSGFSVSYSTDSGETWRQEPDIADDSTEYSFSGDSLIIGTGADRLSLVRLDDMDTIVEPDFPNPDPTPGILASEIIGTWTRVSGDYVTAIDLKDDGTAQTFMASLDAENPWTEVINGEWTLSGDTLRLFNGIKMTSTDGDTWSAPVAEEDQTATVSLLDGDLVVDSDGFIMTFVRDMGDTMAGRAIAGRAAGAAGSGAAVPSVKSRNFLGL
jgi:hypothetical protein